MTTVKAISPSAARAAKQSAIPIEVLTAVNELLIEQFCEGRIILKQDDVIERILEKLPTISREVIFARGYLDFEPIFRKAGWHVEYDRPAYYENYASRYIFKEG